MTDEEFKDLNKLVKETAQQVQSLYNYQFGPAGTNGYGQAEQDKLARASIAALKEIAHATPCQASIEIKVNAEKSLGAIFKRLRQLELRVALYAGGATGVGLGVGKLFGAW